MMRGLYLTTTALFWLLVLAVGLAPHGQTDVPTAVTVQASATPAAASQATASPRVFGLAELARHHTANDCWMAIGGQVYDFTPYVDRHPADLAVIEAWCGKEATEAYQTKGKARPHSSRANAMLPEYLLGPLDTSR